MPWLESVASSNWLRPFPLSLRYIPMNYSLTAAVAVSAALIASSVDAGVLASANFANYTNGSLVGQNGWQQYNTQTTNPIQVNNGSVSWAGTGTTATNHQDAMLAFANQVTQPTVGTTVLNFDMVLRVGTAPTASFGSYFAALNQLTGTGTSGNFQNVRLSVMGATGGFVFATRINGQSGYPLAMGTTVLSLGQTYALRAEINLVAGNANDFVNLYVGSDFNNMSLHATASYTTGTVADISVGAMLLSQFSSGTSFSSDISVDSMSVTLVPAPGAIALLCAAGIVGSRRRR